jgi:hypothetical protein
MKERFYICYVDKSTMSLETYEKLVERAEDNRVYPLEDYTVLVKTEHKKEIEKEYNLKFKSFKDDFVETRIEYGDIEILIQEIVKENEVLKYWDSKTLTNWKETEVLNKAIKRLYSWDDETAINFLREGNYSSLYNDEVKKIMVKTVINKLKEI